jgi:hypothetical protein
MSEPTIKRHRMRRFYLERTEDETGTSGTGVVAEGCEMSNGHVFLTWLSHQGTWAHYDNVKVIGALHGHAGKTKVVWIDSEIP